MTRGPYILAHAVMAGMFIFGLQRFVLQQSLETAGLWTAVFGVAAAVLAWTQTRR